MKYPKYQYRSETSMSYYEFISEGPKGMIRKIVEYSETGTENVYNLGFANYDDKTKTTSDISVTNNGDSLKVLATVASTVYAFMQKNPKAWILATGNTKVRTRLYRMGITNNLAEISEDFKVFGLSSNGEWDDFMVGEDYEAFL